MNYAELCTALQETLENTFEADDLARFARLTEQKIYSVVQPPVLRRNQTAAVTPSNPYLSLPNGFLYVFSLAVLGTNGRYEFLTVKDVNYVREAFPFPGVTGQPRVYGIFDQNSLILGPTPDVNYTVELHFASYPASIVDAGTSWLGDNFDSALFNGMVVEGARFLKLEADQMQVHMAAFQASMAELKQLADGKLRQDNYRTPQVRDPVK